jgi:hypothetical protein
VSVIISTYIESADAWRLCKGNEVQVPCREVLTCRRVRGGGAPREVESFVAVRVDTWEAQESRIYVAVGHLCRMVVHAAEQVLEAYGDLKTPRTTETDEGLSVGEMFRSLDHGGFSACQGEMRSVVETCGVSKGVHDERRRFLRQG